MAKKFGDLFGNMDDVFSGAKISNFDLDDMLSRTRTFTEEVSKRSAEALELYGRLAYEAVQQPQLQHTEALESCGAEITALRTKLDQLTAELEAAKNPTVTTVRDDDVSVS